jgi:hypothetical protein
MILTDINNNKSAYDIEKSKNQKQQNENSKEKSHLLNLHNQMKS